MDQAALYVAKAKKLKTSGYMPRGFKTIDGPNIELAEKFGLKEMDEPGYPARTYKNVATSDATLILTYNPGSPGTLCTIKACKTYKKPFLLAQMPKGLKKVKVVCWLEEISPDVLNVAGSRQTKMNNAFEDAFRFLYEVLP